MISRHFPHDFPIDSAIEIRERLQAAAWLCLEELAASFEAYALELGIERRAQFVFDEPKWAEYEDGKIDRLVGCFAPMVCDLTVAYLDEYPDPVDHDPAVVEATILSLVKAVLKDPFELEPPTWPWRPDDLFDHEDFELAFRTKVRDVLNAMPSAMKTSSTGTKRLGTIRQALLRFFAPKEVAAAALWASFSHEAESVGDGSRTEMNQAMPSVTSTAGSSISESALEAANAETEHVGFESEQISREECFQSFVVAEHPGATFTDVKHSARAASPNTSHLQILEEAMHQGGLNAPKLAHEMRALLKSTKGNRLKVDRTTVYRIIHGETKKPQPEIREALIRVLGLNKEQASIVRRGLGGTGAAQSFSKKL